MVKLIQERAGLCIPAVRERRSAGRGGSGAGSPRPLSELPLSGPWIGAHTGAHTGARRSGPGPWPGPPGGTAAAPRCRSGRAGGRCELSPSCRLRFLSLSLFLLLLFTPPCLSSPSFFSLSFRFSFSLIFHFSSSIFFLSCLFSFLVSPLFYSSIFSPLSCFLPRLPILLLFFFLSHPSPLLIHPFPFSFPSSLFPFPFSFFPSLLLLAFSIIFPSLPLFPFTYFLFYYFSFTFFSLSLFFLSLFFLPL